MENGKKKNTRSTVTRNYPIGGTHQANTSRAVEVRDVQSPKKFSNFNQPLSKVLDRLIQKGLLRPLTVSRPSNPNLPGFDPNSYCKFHQVVIHSTDSCMCLKHKIQNLIDSGKITDPEKSNPNQNTRTNPFPNYQNVPPPTTMMINSRVSEEEVLNSFEDINLQTKEETHEASKDVEKVEDLLVNPQGNSTIRCFTLNHLHMIFPSSR